MEGGGLDYEPGVVTLAAEVRRFDGRTRRPMIAESLRPDFVEHRPVALKITHDDGDTDDSGERGTGGSEDRLQVGEDLFGLCARILRDGVGLAAESRRPLDYR